MHYRDFDRMPVMHWKGWPETYDRWYAEGLPKDVSEHEYFNATPLLYSMSPNISLFPAFEEEILEETEEYRILKQGDGVICKDWKNKSCIPHFIDFTLKDGSNWDEYKKRLQPDPARIPDDLDERIAKANKSEVPVAAGSASLIGWIRNWMGVTNMSYLAYDDRELFREMVHTIADLVVWSLDQVLPNVKVDLAWGWEDICFRTGPLISPDIFEDVAVPAYRKIADKLLEYGVDLYLVDCDGLIDDLAPLWLEGGVNVMFPIEIGAWDADPFSYRKKHGKDLRVFGGINKLVLEKDKYDIGVLMELLEHSIEPEGIIKRLSHIVRPGGAIYITTPNYNGLTRRILSQSLRCLRAIGLLRAQRLTNLRERSLNIAELNMLWQYLAVQLPCMLHAQ